MIRGERFHVDLDSDDEENEAQQSVRLPASFVGDVLERKPAAPKPPSAPALKSKTGFPEHQKRPVTSRFKQQKAATQKSQPPASELQSQHAPTSPAPDESGDRPSGEAKSWEEEEKERIDQENRQRMADMSPAEIEEERQELMKSLSPVLLSRLLQRSNVESGSEEVDLSRAPEGSEPQAEKPKKTPKSVKFEELAVEEVEETGKDEVKDAREANQADSSEPLPHDSVHFPRPPQPPSLDPNSDTFLEDLHQKYFPSLPSDPDKLEWMQSSPSDNTSYDPSATNLSAKDIRFSFKGQLIPPKTAAEIPVTKGLHHHGDAPDAAGYTIPELAHLARSSYPAQRCIAFQSLGRILYRLGRGEFGNSGEPGAETGEDPQDTIGERARRLWGQIEALQVIPTLVNESQGKVVHGGPSVNYTSYSAVAIEQEGYIDAINTPEWGVDQICRWLLMYFFRALV